MIPKQLARLIFSQSSLPNLLAISFFRFSEASFILFSRRLSLHPSNSINSLRDLLSFIFVKIEDILSTILSMKSEDNSAV